jgi:hypothetical protein
VLLHKLLALTTLPVFTIKYVTTAINGSSDQDEGRNGALKVYRRLDVADRDGKEGAEMERMAVPGGRGLRRPRRKLGFRAIQQEEE